MLDQWRGGLSPMQLPPQLHSLHGCAGTLLRPGSTTWPGSTMRTMQPHHRTNNTGIHPGHHCLRCRQGG